MSPRMKMGKSTSPPNLYPLYIFPPSPLSSSRIQSKISVNMNTLIHPITIPNITKIILTLLPRAKALLLRFSKEANSRLSPNSIKMLHSLLHSLLDAVDIMAFVDGLIIPCLKNLMEFVRARPRPRTYVLVRRFWLSFLRKFKYKIKGSTSSSYFRFHYNWSSKSFILPVFAEGSSNSYRSLNVDNKNKGDHSIASSNFVEEGNEEDHASQLNGYLEWLEQRGQGRDSLRRDSSTYITRDVDMLAEKFIEEKYEIFVLEKRESERMFQEMMARSL